MSLRPRRSTARLLFQRKSALRIGWQTSAMLADWQKTWSPRSMEMLCFPHVEMRELLAAARGSVGERLRRSAGETGKTDLMAPVSIR